MTRAPLAIDKLVLVLTDACNLRCAYCYQPPARRGQMSWDTIEAGLAWLRASPTTNPCLVLTGGEPLLDHGLVRRVVERARKARPPGRAVRIVLLTNGTRLGEEAVRFLAKHRVSVQLSMDGARAAQDLRGAGTFDALDGLLGRLRTRHRQWFTNRVSIALTLVPSSIPHLAASVEYLIAKGAREIAVTPAVGTASGWRETHVGELDRQFAAVYDASLAHYRRTGCVPLTVFRKVVPSSRRRPRTWCGIAQATQAVVDVDGHVYGCAAAQASSRDRAGALLVQAADAMRLGHVREPARADSLASYRDALRATGLFDGRDASFSSYGACRTCRYVRQCAACPVATAFEAGAPDPHRVPDFVCAYNQVSLKYRNRFPRQHAFAPMMPPPPTGR